MNKLIVEKVRERSVITSSISHNPIKILNPNSHSSSCHAVFSNYGAGLLQGDDVSIDIDIKKESRCFIGSQAFTRVLKNNINQDTRQNIHGSIDDDALLIFYTEPVVMQQQSRFAQYQTWDITQKSNFILIEAWLCGRKACDERFQYDKLYNELNIKFDHKIAYIDRFEFKPGEQNPYQKGLFGQYDAQLNIYGFGEIGSKSIAALSPFLTEEKADNKQSLIAIHDINNTGKLFRGLYKEEQDLYNTIHSLMQTCSAADYLGFNPLIRKY